MSEQGMAPPYRNVLVVGATSGLGQAVAREFAPLAATVHLTYSSGQEGAEKSAADVVEHGGAAVVHQLTLPDPDVRASASVGCCPTPARVTSW